MPLSCRALFAALLASALLALGAAPARAATVSLSGATLQIVAAPGEANRMTIAPDAAGVAVTDAVEPVAGPGCTLAAAGRVTCAAASAAAVDLGDRDDTLAITASLTAAVTDGEGDDAVAGGSRDDVFIASSGADRYAGGGGRDIVSYAARGAAVVVAIDDVAADGAAGEADDVRSDVEGAIGGSGGDSLTGDASAEVLIGGAGDDTLDGAGGADTLDGGGGFDTVDYSTRTVRVAVDLDDRADDGAAERDNVRSTVERVLGGAAGDLIVGTAGAQTLVGNGGDDDLRGGDGADTLAGGPGADLLRGGNGDDLLDLGAENDSGWGEAGADRLLGGTGSDKLDGGAGADSMAGGEDGDVLAGGGDNDVLDGGTGADDLAGDDGEDTADYSGRSAALHVTLDDAAGDGEGGEGDNVRTTAENVIGGSGPDALTGSAAPNALSGGGGNDVLDGGLGRDRLSAGAGDDRANGGGDVDDIDGGDGDDVLDARDALNEPVRCGAGRDHADLDGGDRPEACETVKTATAPAPRMPAPSTFDPKGPKLKLKGVRRRVGGGRFVPIPGFDGQRIDRRLLADLAYLRQRFRVGIQAGLAMRGHAPEGEHPIGLAVDIVPGRGGSWDDVDRLAKWAEPRQNRPRSPFRWVGYTGDAGHGRGDHLHLSWRHSRARRGHPARTVWTLDLRKPVRKPAAKR
jgi:Ca2+-binding RTX toxin-like protein